MKNLTLLELPPENDEGTIKREIESIKDCSLAIFYIFRNSYETEPLAYTYS